MIVAVHGIAQQLKGPDQLRALWVPALRDGVTFASGATPDDVPFRMAFYGNLFRHQLTTPKTKSGAPDDTLGNLSDDEVDDLLGVISEVVTEAEIAAAAESAEKGFPGVPGPLAHALRAIDARFGAAAGILYLGTMRQVRRYLQDPDLKGAVDQLIADTMAEEMASGSPLVLIGHSLGSVVAYEFVRQHPDHPVDLLLTLGSPLSLRMVRSRLPEPPAGMPAGVRSWVNVRAFNDPVAVGGDLNRFWAGVQDRHVDNGRRDPHSVAAYLSAVETGRPVANALGPGEAAP